MKVPVIHPLIFASILLMPLQSLSLEFYTSMYDLTCFGLLLTMFFIGAKIGLRKVTIWCLLALFSMQLFHFLYSGYAPIHRAVSGYIWLGGLIVVFLESRRVIPRPKIWWRSLVLVMLISGAVIIGEMLFQTTKRPSAFFLEPSYAGLNLYAIVLAVFLVKVVYPREVKTAWMVIPVVFLCGAAAVMTQSAHAITAVASLGAITIFFIFHYLARRSRRARVSFSSGLFLIFFVPVISMILYNFLSQTDLAAKLDFENVDNISTLVWLRGFDQAAAVLAKSPMIGFGLGSTGEFSFESTRHAALHNLGLYNLNLKDAYSLGFRLVIEMGAFFFFGLLVFLFIRFWKVFSELIFIDLRSSSSEFSIDRSERAAMLGLVTYSFVVLAGCFLKEPVYSVGYLYLSVFFFASIGSQFWGKHQLYREEPLTISGP